MSTTEGGLATLATSQLPPLPYDVLLHLFKNCEDRARYRDLTRDWWSARQLAQDLSALCLVSRDWQAHFQPLLWREVTLGDVSDEGEREVVRAFLSTARANPSLNVRINAVRLVKPFRPPAGPESDSQKTAEEVLSDLCRALFEFPALETATLVGNMVAAFTSQRREHVVDPPTLRSVVLAGPPSDLFLGLRNFGPVSTLSLDHPWLATPAFLDRVRIQLENITALHVAHFALPTSHPALTFLLGGTFGKQLTELSLHLSPDCPSADFSAQLLAQTPNLTFLSLSVDGVRVAALRVLPALEILNLHGSNKDLDRTRTILCEVIETRQDRSGLPALRAIQVETELRWLEWDARALQKVCIRLEGGEGVYG